MKNAIIIFIIAIVTLVVFLPSFKTMQEKRQKNIEYQNKIDELSRQYKQLKEERRRLEEDPVYLEKIAREKMGVAKEGEVVYKFDEVNAEEEAEDLQE